MTASMMVVAGVSEDVTTVSQAGRSPSPVSKTTCSAVSSAVSAPGATGPRVRARASAPVVIVSAEAGGSLCAGAVLIGMPPTVSR